MNPFKWLANLFGGGGAPRADKRYLTIYVLSRRCNEPISGQVDLLNSTSIRINKWRTTKLREGVG
jgi:hypothetical protein